MTVERDLAPRLPLDLLDFEPHRPNKLLLVLFFNGFGVGTGAMGASAVMLGIGGSEIVGFSDSGAGSGADAGASFGFASTEGIGSEGMDETECISREPGTGSVNLRSTAGAEMGSECGGSSCSYVDGSDRLIETRFSAISAHCSCICPVWFVNKVKEFWFRSQKAASAHWNTAGCFRSVTRIAVTALSSNALDSALCLSRFSMFRAIFSSLRFLRPDNLSDFVAYRTYSTNSRSTGSYSLFTSAISER